MQLFSCDLCLEKAGVACTTPASKFRCMNLRKMTDVAMDVAVLASAS